MFHQSVLLKMLIISLSIQRDFYFFHNFKITGLIYVYNIKDCWGKIQRKRKRYQNFYFIKVLKIKVRISKISRIKYHFCERHISWRIQFEENCTSQTRDTPVVRQRTCTWRKKVACKIPAIKSATIATDRGVATVVAWYILRSWKSNERMNGSRQHLHLYSGNGHAAYRCVATAMRDDDPMCDEYYRIRPQLVKGLMTLMSKNSTLFR